MFEQQRNRRFYTIFPEKLLVIIKQQADRFHLLEYLLITRLRRSLVHAEFTLKPQAWYSQSMALLTVMETLSSRGQAPCENNPCCHARTLTLFFQDRHSCVTSTGLGCSDWKVLATRKSGKRTTRNLSDRDNTHSAVVKLIALHNIGVQDPDLCTMRIT